MPVWLDRFLKTRAVGLLAAAAVFLLAPALATGQGAKVVDQLLIVQQLESPKWLMRAQAVQTLGSVPSDTWGDEARRLLIRTFAMEEGRLRSKLEGRVRADSYPEIGSERYAEYYSALADLVLKLDTAPALPLLVDYAPGPDPRLDDYIARRGASALPLVIARLRGLLVTMIRTSAYQGPDLESQQAMLDILARMALLGRANKLRQPLSEDDYVRIRAGGAALLSSESAWVKAQAARTLAAVGDPRDREVTLATFSRLLQSPDHNEREIALNTMADLTDPQFLPMADIEKIARRDPFRFLRTSISGEASTVYPLRREAEQILANISKAGKGTGPGG